MITASSAAPQGRDLECGDRERADGSEEREAAEVAAGHGLPLERLAD